MVAADHVVTMVTRVGCHLCETAGAQLRQLSSELGFSFREVDVDGSPALRERYSDKVPVILVDGREHGHFRVDERTLRKALAG